MIYTMIYTMIYIIIMVIIQLIREHLTRSNLPTDQCAVCLYGFREGDEFTKTECYHYFHSHCLAAHVAAAERYYREEQEKLPQWQQDTTNKFQVCLCYKCHRIFFSSVIVAFAKVHLSFCICIYSLMSISLGYMSRLPGINQLRR